jgi:hypothetical protein
MPAFRGGHVCICLLWAHPFLTLKLTGAMPSPTTFASLQGTKGTKIDQQHVPFFLVKRELNHQGKGHLGIQAWKYVNQSKHDKRGFNSGRGKEMRHSEVRVEAILLQFTFSSERREEEYQTTVFRALPEMKCTAE